jgi:hypothetical protein
MKSKAFVGLFVLFVSSLTLYVATASRSNRLPIVFVYTVVPAVCQYGLPEYIRISVEQAIFTQPDCDVYLLSNIGECKAIADSVNSVSGLSVVDSVSISSSRTILFQNYSTGMFSRDYSNELWLTSALRFFILEDLMLKRGWAEMMHVEADNMLYGRLSTILPILRNIPLAATPLNAQKTFITASVFWVSATKHLVAFNDFLLALGSNKDQRWSKYLDWLRIFPNCCKSGGVFPDKTGSGIRPFAINEMSMISYFHEIEPDIMRLLPVLPPHPYVRMRYIIDLAQFAPGGGEVKGLVTGSAIWDPNSWGQFIGGTSSKRGKDKFFSDATHIAGMAIRTHHCRVYWLCGNMTEYGYGIPFSDLGPLQEQQRQSLASIPTTKKLVSTLTIGGKEGRCYTAPFVRCDGEQIGKPFHPLWNLHVHSKHTTNYRSEKCDCRTQMAAEYYVV